MSWLGVLVRTGLSILLNFAKALPLLFGAATRRWPRRSRELFLPIVLLGNGTTSLTTNSLKCTMPQALKRLRRWSARVFVWLRNRRAFSTPTRLILACSWATALSVLDGTADWRVAAGQIRLIVFWPLLYARVTWRSLLPRRLGPCSRRQFRKSRQRRTLGRPSR